MSRADPTDARADSENLRTATWLVEVGSASEPLRPPRVHPIDGLERWVLGRDDPEHAGEPGRIVVPDRWMSARHAELRSSAEGWRLSDLGSANGTLTWGQRRSTGLLHDGDTFETGSTFWMFRNEVLAQPAPTAPVGAGALASIAPRMVALHDRLDRIAKSRLPVVILGPTGAGKEVLARAVHERSGREGRLVVLDVGTIPPAHAAQELFGTALPLDGADRPRAGRLRSASGGTVLVDQLGDMAGEVQVALLRVLQDGEVTPVGSDEPQRVDLRFVATTHEDIDQLVVERRFRSDLWSRLKGFVLTVPPLKERLEDLGLLIARFLERLGLQQLVFTPSAYRALLAYPWPHNVRELERTIESAAALCDGRRIDLGDLPPEVQSHRPPEAGGERSSEETRERELLRLLAAHRGNVSAVARSMGYSRMQVHRWMKQLNVDPNAYRGT